MSDFDSYWNTSHSAKEVEDLKDAFPTYTKERSQLRRMIHQIAERAWISATKKVRKDFDIMWANGKWRINGKMKANIRKTRHLSRGFSATIDVVQEPSFLGPEYFNRISIGEIFEYEGHYYKKLPYELSQKEVHRKKMGLAISLTDEGVYYFCERDTVLACDVECRISYVYARELSVLEKTK